MSWDDVKSILYRVDAEPRIKKRRRISKMKREDLRKIEGITDAQVDAIMKLHQTDAEAWKTEKKTLEDSVTNLTNTVKSFEGVDVKALQKSVSDWETKYNQDIAKAQMEGLVNVALSKAGAKNEKMLRALIDMEKVSVKDGNLNGLDDQIAQIKKDNDFLFEPIKKDVNLGGEHGGGSHLDDDKPMDIYSAVSSYYE